jgi:hypothetical protein
MNHKFLIMNFEFLMPTQPQLNAGGPGQFKIQNSKSKISTSNSESEYHA